MSTETITVQDKEWTNIDYTNTSAYKTVKAWNKIAGVFEEGGPNGVTGGIPHDDFSQLKRLRKFDSKVKEDQGPIQKIITSIHRQLVPQKDKDGRIVSREYLTLQGHYTGYDWAGMEIDAYFVEGWYKVPIMGKVYQNPSQRFDPETGEDLAKTQVKRSEYVFTYELPQDKKERKKYIDDIIANAPGTFPENVKWYYKEMEPGVILPIGGKRDDSFSYEDMTDLTIDELRHLSKTVGGSKGPGVYRDSEGKLRDKNNNLVVKPDVKDNKKKGDVYQ